MIKSVSDMTFDEHVDLFAGRIMTGLSKQSLTDLVAEVVGVLADEYYRRGIAYEQKRHQSKVEEEKSQEIEEAPDVTLEQRFNKFVEQTNYNVLSLQKQIYTVTTSVDEKFLKLYKDIEEALETYPIK